MKTKKIKVDLALVENGLASDIEHARSMISCGLIFIGDKQITNNSYVDETELLNTGFRIKDKKENVSRGGIKLSSVFDVIDIDIKNKICMDVGASTGGFTELLLKKGASKVYSIDVGKNLIDYKLRTNEKVVVLEGVNARFLDQDPVIKNTITDDSIDIVVMDLSFISLKLVLPRVLNYVKAGGTVIPLIKPQFEVEAKEVPKGGVVRDEDVINRVLLDMRVYIEKLGFNVIKLIPSKIQGACGNQEYFFVCLLTG